MTGRIARQTSPTERSITGSRRLNHPGIILVIMSVGALLGAYVAYQFGNGFRPGSVKTIETIGRIETLRMPAKARRLSEIRTFVVQMDGADDYGRVFVNNNLWLNTENPQQIFYKFSGGKDDTDKFNRFAVERGGLLVGKRDARVLLRSGVNEIVVELENSILGTCVTSIDIVVNGEELETFPRTIPYGLDVEPEVTNLTLLKQFKKAERFDFDSELTAKEKENLRPSDKNELSVSSLEDVICARRIFQFELE